MQAKVSIGGVCRGGVEIDHGGDDLGTHVAIGIGGRGHAQVRLEGGVGVGAQRGSRVEDVQDGAGLGAGIDHGGQAYAGGCAG